MGRAAAQSGLPSDPENASKSLISVSSVRLSGARRQVAAGGSRHQADAAAAVLRLQREVAAVELLGLRRAQPGDGARSEEHTSELQSLMRTSYAVSCLKKKTTSTTQSIIRRRT